ncbi:MAG: DNA polymerase II, partial [candidate division NC10 bacterium]
MTSIPRLFFDNPLLFGRDATEGLVAFEPRDGAVRAWARQAGRAVATDLPFRPFLLLTDAALLGGFTGDTEITPLDGEEGYRWLAVLPSWAQAEKARDHCRKVSGRAPGSPDAPYRFLGDPTHQFLLRTGKTSFR